MKCKDFEPSIIQDNNDLYINIKDIAEAKGLTSTRAIWLKLNDPECGYISREVKVSGGISYEILFSSLEPETQKLLLESNKKSSVIFDDGSCCFDSDYPNPTHKELSNYIKGSKIVEDLKKRIENISNNI